MQAQWGTLLPFESMRRSPLISTTLKRLNITSYAFHVGEDKFDTILGSFRGPVPYGSEPRSLETGQLNSRRGGGFTFVTQTAMFWKLLTRT